MIRGAFAVAAMLLLAACSRMNTQLDAAEDIRAFVQAVRSSDRAAFDAHVDRAALRADIQRQIASRTGGGEAASVLLGSSLGGSLVDRMIAPETFNLALSQAAPSLNRTPTAPEIAAVLKTVSEDSVCLPQGGRDGPCALTFARQGETWRLVKVDAASVAIQQLPFPPSAAG